VSNITLISEEFHDQLTLIRTPSISYSDLIRVVPKQLADKRICYVTLNKTYDALINLFQMNDIPVDNTVFIDAITKSLNEVDNVDNCYFVSSPHALTELSIVINEFIQHSFEYLLFDSLTTLLIYHRKEEIVIKFLSSIINVLKAFNCKGIFYVLNTDEHQLLIDEATMLMDKTVDIGY